jgi:hypothetical protein
MKKCLPFILTLAIVAVSGCGGDIVAPDKAAFQPSQSISPSTGTPVTTYYAACINSGVLGTVSAVGSSTIGPACLIGRAVVLSAGSALNFCYQPGGDINSFTSGAAACKRNFVGGGFAAGTDLFGCLNKSSLTALGGNPPKCGKPATMVGLAFPPVVLPPPCTPSLAITGPIENANGYAVVYRATDFAIGASLGGGCIGAWTYSWSYKLGDDAAAAVPATWTGSASASLTVPKWTLEKFPTAMREYIFTATATPPPGSGLQPVTATVHLRVLGTVPSSLYSPRGFGTVPPGLTLYTSQAVDFDNPPDQQKLIFRWVAVNDQDVVPVTPFSGADTHAILYDWDPSFGFITLTLTVCPSDEPLTPENPIWTPERMLTGCRDFSDNFLILSA